MPCPSPESELQPCLHIFGPSCQCTFQFWGPNIFTIATDNDHQLVVSFSGFSTLPPYFFGVPKFSPKHQQLPIAKVAFLGAAAHPGLVVAGRRRIFASTTNKLFIGFHGKYWKIHHQWMLPAGKIWAILDLLKTICDFMGNPLGKSMENIGVIPVP